MVYFKAMKMYKLHATKVTLNKHLIKEDRHKDTYSMILFALNSKTGKTNLC